MGSTTRWSAGDGGPESRLRVRIEGTAHRLRVRGRDPDSVQESPFPAGRGAALGHQRDATGAALRRRGLVGAGQACQRVVPRTVGAPRRAHGSPARAGARVQSLVDLEDDRIAGRERLGVHRRWTGGGRERPLGHHQQSQPQRDGEPGLLPGRVGRGTIPVRPEERALLLREAAVLPRRHRAIQHAQLADLHAAHRPADGRRQAHRQGIWHRHRAALRGGRSGRLGDRRRPSGLQPPPAAARRRGAVARRRGLHRPGRGQRLQPRGRRRRPDPLRRGVQRPAPAGRQPHPHRRHHDDGADVVHAVRPERADLRLSRSPPTRAIRTSGRGAASSRVRGCPTSTSIRG